MEKGDLGKFTEILIPPIKSITGWKEIEIRKSGEPLIPLNELPSNLIVVDSQYHKQGINHSSPVLYARETVAHMVIRAAKLLPKSYKLIIWDAWRPLDVQQALFNAHLRTLKEQKPETPLERLKEEAQTYVSLPSNDPLKPSPHHTGGSIDLSILTPDGNLLDLGTEFDHFGPEAATRFYEDRSLNLKEASPRNNRRLLYHVMLTVGFSEYDKEWWHFDFGNQFDAVRNIAQLAIYGAIVPLLC